jgi:hypothetical protein
MKPMKKEIDEERKRKLLERKKRKEGEGAHIETGNNVNPDAGVWCDG